MADDSWNPTDALEVLGDETRIAILRELAEADDPLRFSTLRERVGVRDSGKFNYHLDRLCDYFVRDAGGAYELRPAGARLIAASRVDPEDVRGDPDDDGPVTPGGTDSAECPVCGDEECEKLFHVHLTPPWR